MSAFPTPIYDGVDPEANNGPQLIAVGSAFICISFIAILLRMISRKITRIEYGWDDYLIIISAVLSWAYSAGVIAEVQYNFYGQHIGKTDAEHLKSWFIGLFAIAILYPPALTASKLSLLALLYRIFGVNKTRIPLWIVSGLNIGWMISAVLVGIFSCRPVNGFWNLEIESKCIQEFTFFMTNECITITLDLIVIFMPIYFISQIKRSFSQKMSISSTFALGLIATIVSAIRLWQLVVAQQKPGFDPTFNQTPAALWAIIELNVWIVVACIPAWRPLITRAYTRLTSEEGSYFTIGSYRISWKRTSHSKASLDTPNFKEMKLPLQQTNGMNLVPSDQSYSTRSMAQRKHHKHDSLLNTTNGTDTNRDSSKEDMELGMIPGIRVDREFEVTRPQEAHHVV